MLSECNFDISKLNYLYTVFYKFDNSYGWYIGRFIGKYDELTARFEQKTKNRELFDYRIYSGSHGEYTKKDEEEIWKPAASEAAMLSWFVYSIELDKWFMDDNDVIPYPKTPPKEITDNFSINVEYKEEDNDIEEIKTDYEQGIEPEIYGTFEFKTPKQYCESLIESLDCKNDLEKCINNIKQDKYACFVIQKIDLHKFLAWGLGDKMRLILQDYNYEKVKIKLDVIIPKQLFFNELEKVIKKSQKQIKQIITKVKK